MKLKSFGAYVVPGRRRELHLVDRSEEIVDLYLVRLIGVDAGRFRVVGKAGRLLQKLVRR